MLPASLQPFAKSIYPALGTLIAVLGQVLATGEFDRAELATAVTGLLASALAYAVSNDTTGEPA
jgi:hypothetical protein